MSYPGMASCTHPENAMPWRDMKAIEGVANRRNEVITFRSTGPWSKRWLEANYPTKGFHVKGKSSDWGPMAGLVPWEGRFSKVSPNPVAIAKGNKFNHDGVHEGFAQRIPLVLSENLLNVQLTTPAGRDNRVAIIHKHQIENSEDLLLYAVRSGDGTVIPFRAVKERGEYSIYGFADNAPLDEPSLEAFPRAPLEVMASTEMGTIRPMTGDYDLFNICPTWNSYGGALQQSMDFGGVAFGANDAQSLTFRAGHGLDKVMDHRLHTGTGTLSGQRAGNQVDWAHRRAHYLSRLASMHVGSTEHTNLKNSMIQLGILDRNGTEIAEDGWHEHRDMGNLTPRILQCILELNVAMGQGPMGINRRVHHNAESHRNRLHGGLTYDDMVEKKDGMPITIFQPSRMPNGLPPVVATGYDTIDTIETWPEFANYATRLKAAGFYVPQSWMWGRPDA
jgi:hypothetical protein